MILKARLSSALLVLVVQFGSTSGQKQEAGFVDLFNGKDLSGFKVVCSAPPGKPNKTAFTVKDGVIDVAGDPYGYFYTDKSYKNYVLRFDWKFLKNGGAGTLIHITGDLKGRLWPKCIEVQGGLERDHGSIHGLGAKGVFSTDWEAQKKAVRKRQWNTTEIISKDGELTCKINGVQVTTGKGELSVGPIGWQSEGGHVLLKNIRIKVR